MSRRADSIYELPIRDLTARFDACSSLSPLSGRNAILVYSVDPSTGELAFQSDSVAPGEKDGPRHAVPSRDGKWVFSVTEHSELCE